METKSMLELIPVKLEQNYLKKWNASHYSGFVHLYKDGKRINDSLYRKGGMFNDDNLKKNYFMILKYKECFYEKYVMDIVNQYKSNKNKSSSAYLKSFWIIIDKNGIEKKEFEDSINPPYIEGGQIYSINSKYYNIETGEFYGYANHSLKSKDFLFIDNKFTELNVYKNHNFDEKNIGIMKINIHDGSFEVFK